MEQHFFFVLGSIGILAVIFGIILAIMGRNDGLSQEIDEIEKHKAFVARQRENKTKKK